MSAAAPARPELISLDDAVARILGRVPEMSPANAETVSTFDALGRVLAAGRSLADRRAARRQQRDGRLCAARRRRAGGGHASCRVSQRIAAGSVGVPLEAGSAARIFTGAQMPAGADAVVMQEQCSAVDGGVRVDVVPRSRPVDPAPRRRRRARRRRAARRPAPLAAGARHGGLGRRRHAPGRPRGRAWRCSRPATNWRCRASRSSPARSTTRTASRCAA